MINDAINLELYATSEKHKIIFKLVMKRFFFLTADGVVLLVEARLTTTSIRMKSTIDMALSRLHHRLAAAWITATLLSRQHASFTAAPLRSATRSLSTNNSRTNTRILPICSRRRRRRLPLDTRCRPPPDGVAI